MGSHLLLQTCLGTLHSSAGTTLDDSPCSVSLWAGGEPVTDRGVLGGPPFQGSTWACVVKHPGCQLLFLFKTLLFFPVKH